MRSVLLVIILFEAGCFSMARFDQAHATRVREINVEQDSRRREVLSDAQRLVDLINERRKYLVAVEPGSKYSPLVRIDASPEVEKLRALCVRFDDLIQQMESAGQDAASIEEAKRECEVRFYQDLYVPLLVSTYYKADAQWAIRTYVQNPGRYDIEALFLHSHNAVIAQEIERDIARVIALRDQRLEHIERWRSEQIGYSASDRDREISAAREEHRRQMQAVGAALSSMSASSRTGTASPVSTPYSSIDGTYGNASPMRTGPTLCPDGTYVTGTCTLAPDGTYVGGRPTMAPDGTYVTGRPTMAPDGTYVGGDGKVVMCPDGSYAAGTRCVLTPNGQYVGE